MDFNDVNELDERFIVLNIRLNYNYIIFLSILYSDMIYSFILFIPFSG